MTLPSPLGIADLEDVFGLTDCLFTLDWHAISDDDGASEKIYAYRSPASYMATMTSRDLAHADAARVSSVLASAQSGGRQVLLYDKSYPYPSTDPDGSLLSGSTLLLGTITDRLTAAFTGFPAGFVVPAGTYFGIIYDTSRYYLAQFAESKTASGGGAITATTLTLPLPAAIVPGAGVNMRKPLAKFKIDPSSVRPSTSSGRTKRVSWTANQTMLQ